MSGYRFRHPLVGAPRVLAGLLTLLVATSGPACVGGARLANAESSPEEIVLAVLDALERKDSEHLRELALSEEEFREIVWPELPAARPERNLPFSDVWGDLKVKSDAALAGLLKEYGGRALVLTDLRFRGGTTQYESYVVHRTPTLRVLDAGGVDHELRLFGSILERGGRFKLFSYVVD